MGESHGVDHRLDEMNGSEMNLQSQQTHTDSPQHNSSAVQSGGALTERAEGDSELLNR